VLVSKTSIAGWGINAQNCHIEIFVGLSDCYDEKTEVLTRSGWKLFGDVTYSDRIASVNPENLNMEWQQPTKIVWEDYEGEMIQFQGQRNFDLCVTPNHKLFVSRPTARYPASDGKYRLEYAQDIFDGYKRMCRTMLSAPTGFMADQIPHNVKIPTPNGQRISNRSKIVSETTPENMCKLAGWFISEGYCRPVGSQEFGRIVISQGFMHEKYRAEIVSLLGELGLHTNDKTKDITAYSSNLARFLLNEFGTNAYNKRIPEWMKNYPKHLLVILRDTLLKGDGGFKGDVATYYRTCSKQLANDFQEICLKTGVRASLKVRWMTTNCKERHLEYDVVIAWEHIQPYIHEKPQKIDYRGKIGCVSVPNHVIIVRRNGIPVVSGNSFESYYQAVRRCWRYGQTKPVDVYIVVSEAEGAVKANIERKQKDAERMTDELIGYTREFLKNDLHATTKQTTEYFAFEDMEVPEWLTTQQV
jgi:replicative DNA helicase Mcm